MNIKDLVNAAVNKVRGTEILSPIPQSQVFASTNDAKKQQLEQQFWDLADYKDSLEAQRDAGMSNDNVVTNQLVRQGKLPANKAEVYPQGKSLPAQAKPQVLGATTGDTSFQKLIEIARAKAESQGFHPAPIVSQMASESMRGKSRFAKERNNLFGIGAFDNNLNNTHRYESPEQSIDAYLELISTDPRYSQAYQQRQDPVAYINAIKAAGYATDPNYVQTTMNTPEWRAMMQ